MGCATRLSGPIHSADGPPWVVAFLFESSTRRGAKTARHAAGAAPTHTRGAVWDVKRLTAHELAMPQPGTVSPGMGGDAPSVKWTDNPRVVELHSLDHLLIGVCETGSAAYVDAATTAGAEQATLPADVALVWDVRHPRCTYLQLCRTALLRVAVFVRHEGMQLHRRASMYTVCMCDCSRPAPGACCATTAYAQRRRTCSTVGCAARSTRVLCSG